MALVVRKATMPDLPSMFRISATAHQAGYGAMIPAIKRKDFERRYALTTENEEKYKSVYTKRMQDPSWRIWVAEQDGEIAGYTLSEIETATLVHKRGLFVVPKYQGSGIGSALSRLTEEYFPDATVDLNVLKANLKARHIYEKEGYVETGPAKTFFGAEQVMMTRRPN